MTDAKSSDLTPRLYHTFSSYYSMIARLALAEGAIAYEKVFVDIHYHRAQQDPDYVRINPGMTVPTLVLPDRTLVQSRDIAEYALRVSDATLDPETKAWLDLHYAYPIEELTFGALLSKNPIARVMVPRHLDSIRRDLLARAAKNPDLADVYKARAEVFAERVRTFEPSTVIRLSERRRAEAFGFMDRLDATLSDSRPTLVSSGYGPADVVWTVFLGRMEFAGLGGEIPKRPALARYWREMQARPSFGPAEIWTKVRPLRLIGGILGVAR